MSNTVTLQQLWDELGYVATFGSVESKGRIEHLDEGYFLQWDDPDGEMLDIKFLGETEAKARITVQREVEYWPIHDLIGATWWKNKYVIFLAGGKAWYDTIVQHGSGTITIQREQAGKRPASRYVGPHEIVHLVPREAVTAL